MVKDALDRMEVVFDDERSIADRAGWCAATLARRLGSKRSERPGEPEPVPPIKLAELAELCTRSKSPT